MHALHAVASHLARWWRAVPEGWKTALEVGDWLLALVWCVRTRTLMQRLGEVPDLSEARWDVGPAHAPGLVVVVPARNEAKTVVPAMETLLAQDYPWLRIVAVDDRSMDGTGDLLDGLATRWPQRLGVLHVREAAEGWVAKSFAMESAARASRSEWLLFTDADVWFSPSILRRALAYAELSGADHVVVAPSAVIRGWGESVLLGFLSILAVWVSRPWRVADPRATWDFVGAGGFNLLRRARWEEMGGFEPQRLSLVEDLTLGRRVRAAGLRQRLVFAPGLVLVHWATGMRGLVRGMTKNLFAEMGLRLWVAAVSSALLLTVFVLPLLGLGWRRTWVPSLLLAACVGVHYRVLGEVTGVDARWGWLYPLGAMAMLWAILRSTAVTLVRRGVCWRGTLYPLRELRGFNTPWQWEFAAARLRAEQRRVARGARVRQRIGRWARMLRGGRSKTPAGKARP